MYYKSKPSKNITDKEEDYNTIYAEYSSRIISSKKSKFIPLWALDYNLPLNDEFISWVKVPSAFSKKSKNADLIYELLCNVTAFSNSLSWVLSVNKSSRNYYLPYQHTLFKKFTGSNGQEYLLGIPPLIIFSLVAPSPKRTADRDLILLARKDTKERGNYELFVKKIINTYAKTVEVLYVDAVEDYIYVDPLDVFGVKENQMFETEEDFNNRLKEILFEQPPNKRTQCGTGICETVS